MKILTNLLKFYYRFIASPVAYAKHIGVNVGEHCFISTRNWSTEPYLITIGDNVQITAGVWFFTHGGGMWLVKNIRNLMYLVKLKLKIGFTSVLVR